MSYKASEKKFFKWNEGLRAKVYAPVLDRLGKWGVRPNHITNARAILFVALVMYPLYITGNLFLATVYYFLVFWLLDTFDGALARHLKQASDRGKFFDMTIDVLGYSLFIMGVAYLGDAETFTLFYHVIVHATVYLLAIIFQNENQKSNWIIRPEANLTYIKFTAHIFIVLFVLSGVNLIDSAFVLLNTWMTILAIYYYIKIQRREYKG